MTSTATEPADLRTPPPHARSGTSAGPLPDLLAPRGGVPRLVWAFLIADVLLAIASLVAFEMHHQVWESHLFSLFSLGGEVNFGTWFSMVQLASVGLLLAGFAAVMTMQGRPGAWLLWLGPLMFLYLSADEAVMLHEWLGDVLQRRLNMKDAAGTVEGPFQKTGYWMILLVPVFLAGVAVVAWLTRPYWRGRYRVCVLLGAGVALLVLSAAGIEALGNLVPAGRSENFVVTLEEFGEMLAGTLFLWGTCELLRSHGLRLFTLDPTVRA